jgi:threonine dehydrogenase-like Zn-dependent dehydrogenase
MKALYTAGPGYYGLVDRPVPNPAADECLVQVCQASICHTDVIIRDGAAGHVRYPFVPGHEFAGIITQCGAAVRWLARGDRVAVHTVMACGQCPRCRRGDTNGCEHHEELGSSRDGGFAEYCAVPARHLFRLPDHVTLAEGAMVEPLANAVSAVRQLSLQRGERAVVIGPGPIGLLALQVAQLRHPSLLVLVGTRDERLTFGDIFGATHVVNIRSDGGRQHLASILDGAGADVVIECAGTRSALELALEIVGWRGRIGLEGVLGVDELVPISPYQLLSNSASLVGINGWVTADFAEALELMSAGLVETGKLVSRTFALEQWETAFDMVTLHKDEVLKVQFAL